MKKLLAATFVALLVAGCGGGDSGSDSPESNQTSVETIDLDDNETRNRIIAEAIDGNTLQWRGEWPKIPYAPNQQTPYSGWMKVLQGNGQLLRLKQYKDGQYDGLVAAWYRNGQKRSERTYKDGKLWTAIGWKPNGEKNEVNIVNGNGLWVVYDGSGREASRETYKNSKVVKGSLRQAAPIKRD